MLSCFANDFEYSVVEGFIQVVNLFLFVFYLCLLCLYSLVYFFLEGHVILMFYALLCDMIVELLDGLFAGFRAEMVVETVDDIDMLLIFSLKIYYFLFEFGYFRQAFVV